MSTDRGMDKEDTVYTPTHTHTHPHTHTPTHTHTHTHTYTHTLEYYSAINRNEIGSFVVM